ISIIYSHRAPVSTRCIVTISRCKKYVINIYMQQTMILRHLIFSLTMYYLSSEFIIEAGWGWRGLEGAGFGRGGGSASLVSLFFCDCTSSFGFLKFSPLSIPRLSSRVLNRTHPTVLLPDLIGVSRLPQLHMRSVISNLNDRSSSVLGLPQELLAESIPVVLLRWTMLARMNSLPRWQVPQSHSDFPLLRVCCWGCYGR
ncbi:hypothetical protein PMAYCL1PPCAC_22724, partial [Pristionchus mayeri]